MLIFEPELIKELKEEEDEEENRERKPKCRFQAPPNRFDIPPGYRWDGVIRGNGYEERRFQVFQINIGNSTSESQRRTSLYQ